VYDSDFPVRAPASLTDCIVQFNDASTFSNYIDVILNYCCATPLPADGVGNVTEDPLFVDPLNGDFSLQPASPCINAGNNDSLTTTNTTDLDGNPRISGVAVDVGAYEFLFTPRSAVNRLIVLLQAADIDARTKQPLLVSLNAAMASVQRANLGSAINQLAAFQNKVRAQLAPGQSIGAQRLIDEAEAAIELLRNSQ
jgi:hypothetical protein